MTSIKGRSVFGSIARGELTFYHRDEFIINKIKGRCEPVERQIIDLKLQGYDSKAIGAIIGCSNNTVIKHFRTVKEKAQAVAEEYK